MGKVIEGGNSTLFGGVSKQPPQVRRPNQVEAQDNALSSVVTGGFEKRPNTQYVANLTYLDSTKNYKIHPIDRDASNKLFVAFETGAAPALFVLDATTGTQKTVAVGDTTHTFLVGEDRLDTAVNSGIIYTKETTTSFVEQLAFDSGETQFDWAWEISDGTTFRFKIQGSPDNNTWYDLATGLGGAATGTTSTTIDAAATGDHNYIRFVTTTDAADTAADTISIRATFQDMTYLLNADPEDLKITSVADYTFIVNRNVTTRMEAVGVNDESGTIQGTRQTFSDLPGSPTINHIYKVEGNDSDGFGTYYVKVTQTSPTVYSEIADPTNPNAFSPNSMPHQLVRSADGTTFTFSAATWNQRPAGNTTVNPNPGFIGGKINDVTFYRNRLVFLSDETAYLSQAGDVFSLFAAKATDVLDSDPIERGATTNNVNILQYGITFRKLLFLTSAQAQFELDSGDRAMTPTNAKMDQATTYRASTLCKPASMGDVLFFPAKTEDSAVVYEYYFQEQSFSNTALDVSRHIKTYIGNDILEMWADPASTTLFVLTTAEQNALFVYRTYFDGSEKLQSSWSRYTFGATESDAFIHGFALFDGYVHMIIERSDTNMYLEKMPIERETNAASMPFMPLIDQRDSLTGTYNSANDVTHWATAWKHSDDAEVVLGGSGAIPGRTLQVSYPDHVRFTLASVAAGETLVYGGKTFTADATTTTTSAREFDISGNDIADAGELTTCLNDATDGIGANYLAVDNGDGTVDVRPLDTVDNTAPTAATGTAITNATITATQLDNLVAARGDHSAAAAYVGRKYTMTVELSKIYPLDGEQPIVTGRLQLQDITTLYSNTGYFELKITPDGGRSAKSYKFEGKVLGDSGLVLDSPSIDASGFFGHKKVMSRADTVKIEYVNDTPEPCVITSVQWRGFFNEQGRQD
jgi:hypothetical protein